MIFDDRSYRTLLVSSSEKFSAGLSPLLSSANCTPVTTVSSVSAASRALAESRYDLVIVNAPLPDDFGTSLARSASSDRTTVCLLFSPAERFEELRATLTPSGVFVMTKPTSPLAVRQGLDFLRSASERLALLEQKNVSVEEKMEEIRLVNRAKWLLIENLGMTEQSAHRYIEKQAMDRCVTRREVARDIIKTYT